MSRSGRRARSSCSTYWKEPERFAACFVEGPEGRWFRTGDRAERDADGYLWYRGRSDDVINSAGYRIGPLEVENALLEHEAVQICAVVGSPDPERGEIVKAFVVLRDGLAALARAHPALQDHVKAVTAPYKYPRAIAYVDRSSHDADGQDPPSRPPRRGIRQAGNLSMMQPPPAIPGMREDEIDTPALVVDLDAFEDNLDRMAALLRRRRAAAAGARQDAQVAGDRASADGARRGRAMRAEGRRGRGPRLGRRARHPGLATRSSARRSSPASRRCRASPRSPSASTTRAQIAALEAGGRGGRTAPRRRSSRSMSARAAAACRPGRRRSRSRSGSPARRISRFGGLQAYHGRAQHLRTLEEREAAIGGAADACPPHGRAAAAGRARLPDRRRRRHRHLRASSRRRASTPRSRPAATSSWMPITRGTSTRRQAGLVLPPFALRARDRDEPRRARHRRARCRP